MNAREIIQVHRQICDCLQDKRIFDAFILMKSLLKELQEWWAISQKENLETVYKQLLTYYIDGVEDSERQHFYRDLQVNIYTLADKLKELLLFKSSPSFEYIQKRYFLDKNIDFKNVIFELETYYSNLSLGDLLQESLNVEGKQKEFALQYESTVQMLFFHFWLSDEWTQTEKDFLERCLEENDFDVVLKSLLISAIMLSLLRTFDVAKFSFLLSQMLHDNPCVRQRVLVGIVLVCCRYRARLTAYKSVVEQLASYEGNRQVANEMESVIIQLIRTFETETVTKRIKEDILPEIQRLSPLIQKKMEESGDKSEDFDEKNPEWQNLLEDSTLSDKFQQFGEMQMDGADVYVSTFAALKNFPFFNDISNWFIPFDITHTAIADLFVNKKSILSVFIKNPYLCDSDKYSFCLSILQMPTNQREMVLKASNAEAEQIDELMKDENDLSNEAEAKRFSNQYVQDLYRFYTLYPKHADFENPLKEITNIDKTLLFDFILNGKESKQHIAEFYFSKDLYEEALSLFQELLLEDKNVSNSLLQKVGYCYQRIGNLQLALKFYQDAELIESGNRWTLRHCAYCCRRLGMFEQALTYYQNLEKLLPDNISVLTNMAMCFLQQENYKEALSIYFKIIYISSDNPKILRQMTWCYFMMEDLVLARKYCNKVINIHPINTDYLNLGHIFFAEKNTKKAVECYVKGLTMTDKQSDFWNLFEDDIKYLLKNGVQKETISMIIDAVKYQTDTLE